MYLSDNVMSKQKRFSIVSEALRVQDINFDSNVSMGP